MSCILPRALGQWQFRAGHVVPVPRGSSWLALLPQPLLQGSPSLLETPVGFIVLLFAPHSIPSMAQNASLPLGNTPCASPWWCPALPGSSVGTATALGHSLSPPLSHPQQSARPSCLCSDPWLLLLSLETRRQLCHPSCAFRTFGGCQGEGSCPRRSCSSFFLPSPELQVCWSPSRFCLVLTPVSRHPPG